MFENFLPFVRPDGTARTVRYVSSDPSNGTISVPGGAISWNVLNALRKNMQYDSLFIVFANAGMNDNCVSEFRTGHFHQVVVIVHPLPDTDGQNKDGFDRVPQLPYGIVGGIGLGDGNCVSK
ncbi:MAG: hypothetical protein R3B96_01460 [Pirellulaceae bacterium]